MARSVLQIAQDCALKVGLDYPTTLFAESSRTLQEMVSVLNEVAERIVNDHDWTVLQKVETHVGDGSTESFPLPNDYVRMLKDTQIWSTRWQRPLLPLSSDDYQRLEIREYDLITGTWLQRAGEIFYRPVLANGENALFSYVSNLAVKSPSGSEIASILDWEKTGGVNQITISSAPLDIQTSPRLGDKNRFTADDDCFVLEERLLELGFIWEWRQRKGQPYAEDMATYGDFLAKRIAADGGAKILVQSSRANSHGKVAYPWSITPL